MRRLNRPQYTSDNAMLLCESFCVLPSPSFLSPEGGITLY